MGWMRPNSPPMTFDEMLHHFGATPDLVTDEQRARLDGDGFVALPDHLPPGRVDGYAAAIDELLEREGTRAGSEFHPEPGAPRLSNLVSKGRLFRELAVDATVLALARRVIGRPFKLHGFNERDALRGQGHQALHADWGRRAAGEPYRLVNTLWLVDDVTPANGPTRLVPGSHRLAGSVDDHVPDPSAPHPDEVLATGTRGTVYVYNAHLWHAGTRNASGQRRRIMHVSYVDRDSPQQLDQKRYLDPQLAATLPPELLYLLDVDRP